MKAIHKKKLENAAASIGEVLNDFETESKEDLDNYGELLDNMLAAIDSILEDSGIKDGSHDFLKELKFNRLR